ncbi:hypothetical protein SAMN06269173_104262 [Hymenobacter mucosus]|uniref:Uncharacterized protein n=1 Tax=Hymenobacter mucosus TaxID=1411120 RepID=A0A238XQB6_9BACT|nr:hypothetical protein SAMN06269173_104262 [Hymenobacter mucosus]
MRSLNASTDAKLKGVLTPQQFKPYQTRMHAQPPPAR